MSIGARLLATAGALLVAATLVGVGYCEWWGGDADGVGRALYPLAFSSGVVLLIASRQRPRLVPRTRRTR